MVPWTGFASTRPRGWCRSAEKTGDVVQRYRTSTYFTTGLFPTRSNQV